MNDQMTYIVVGVVAFWAYKLYSQYKVIKQVPSLLAQGGEIIDVRSPLEFSNGHANGSKNIPLNVISEHLNEINKDIPVILCCASGSRSGMAKSVLKRNGYTQIYNAGSWHSLKGMVVSSDIQP